MTPQVLQRSDGVPSSAAVSPKRFSVWVKKASVVFMVRGKSSTPVSKVLPRWSPRSWASSATASASLSAAREAMASRQASKSKASMSLFTRRSRRRPISSSVPTVETTMAVCSASLMRS